MQMVEPSGYTKDFPSGCKMRPFGTEPLKPATLLSFSCVAMAEQFLLMMVRVGPVCGDHPRQGPQQRQPGLQSKFVRSCDLARSWQRAW